MNTLIFFYPFMLTNFFSLSLEVKKRPVMLALSQESKKSKRYGKIENTVRNTDIKQWSKIFFFTLCSLTGNQGQRVSGIIAPLQPSRVWGSNSGGLAVSGTWNFNPQINKPENLKCWANTADVAKIKIQQWLVTILCAFIPAWPQLSESSMSSIQDLRLAPWLAQVKTFWGTGIRRRSHAGISRGVI